MRLLIALNTWKYGKGASREVLRDLLGELNTPNTTATTARKRPLGGGRVERESTFV
jgi:hypothetical protein